MPPASPETTLAWRSASSSEVLPWSTWPITVTTGERGSVSVESSTTSNRPSSTSDAATRLTVWPISSAISCAVSASITSVILCIAPCFISRRMTSTARSDMRLASSWMVMASGITTSRISFSFGSLEAWPFRRWVRRRNEAIERSRTSSALSAVTSVRRPRSFCGAGLVGGLRGHRGAHGAAGAATDLARTFIFIGTVGSNAGGARGRRCRSGGGTSARRAGARRGALQRRRRPLAGLASASPNRFLASISALRLASSSSRCRSSSALRRASAASRSACSMPSRLARRLASSSASRRSSTSRTLASASALARAERSSSVSVRSTTPEPLRGAPAGVRGAGSGGLCTGAALAVTATGSGACVSPAGASPPTRRLPRFSTTTCLVRPWLKLWRTVPVSTRGLSVKVLVGTLKVLSPGVLVSTIQQS